MPKNKENLNEQEALNELEGNTEPTQETMQEAREAIPNEQESEQEKGFFGKTLDKAKELANEAKEATQDFFSKDSNEGESSNEAKKASFNTPSLKSITKKYSLVNCLAFQYIGADDFNMRIGSASYTFSTGEVIIVPNDATAQWLKHKNTLFVLIS